MVNYFNVLGKINIMREENFFDVFQAVVQLLESDAEYNQKVRILHAMFQFLFENLLISEEIFSSLRKFLSEDKYNKYFVIALNQKSILDFFLKKSLHAEIYVQPFIGNIPRIFNEKSIFYILHKDLHPMIFVIFGCHPALIKDLELQKKWVQSFLGYPETPVSAAYITDEALDCLNEEEVFKFACALAESNSIKTISFSIDKLKDYVLLNLIAGDTQRAKRCLEKLNNTQFVYDPNPKSIDMDIEQLENFTLQDFLVPEAVEGALELFSSHNLGLVIDFVGHFVKKYNDKEKVEEVYRNFRNKVLDLIKENPHEVSLALYLNLKNTAVRLLVQDQTFRNVVEQLRMQTGLPEDFYYFSREILQYS